MLEARAADTLKEAAERGLVADALNAVGALLDAIDWTLYEQCVCGHRRIEHIPGRYTKNGMEPCARRDCGCHDFDALRDAQEPLSRHPSGNTTGGSGLESEGLNRPSTEAA